MICFDDLESTQQRQLAGNRSVYKCQALLRKLLDFQDESNIQDMCVFRKYLYWCLLQIPKNSFAF
jgi:hypothetical protein